jgi:predicted nucleic acid-binding protein
MASYLIDSSILIDLSRKYAPAKKWIDQFEIDDLVISFVSVAELLSGCRNKREQERVEADLVDYPILWATQEAQLQAMALLGQFQLSHGIGFLDCMIAATALTNGLALATANYKHFQMIPGLKVERPY